MTTQSNVSSPIEVARVRPLSWPLALAILALGLILGVFAANLAAAINKSDVAAVPKRVVRDFPARPNLLELERKAHISAQANAQRGREAEAARYTSLGLFYAAGTEEQATAAEAARYNGLAEFYGANVTPVNTQRAREAEAARYTSLGLFYTAGSEAEGQQATVAEAARYNGLAEFYGANVTPSPMDNALFAYHQSERGRISADSHTLAWPPRPTQFYPVQKTIVTLDDVGLAQYRQSEWGRMPQASEANPDGDIGLMEFSAKKVASSDLLLTG